MESIPWQTEIDLDKRLLPIGNIPHSICDLNPSETHALSWTLGLLALGAISQHEKVLNELKALALDKHDIHSLEGHGFFLEEAIHALGFDQYLSRVAEKLNITTAELHSFLPSFQASSLVGRLYRLDALLGGNAIWWTVAATEEESIQLFNMIRDQKHSVDNLFYHLNHQHFIEEARHSSFSYKMLRDTCSPLRSRLSYYSSRVFQAIWIAQQLNRLSQIERVAYYHPMLKEMADVVKKLRALPKPSLYQLLFKEIPYISLMLSPETHPRMRRELRGKA